MGRRFARIRSVVTGALEIERAQKRIGSSLEAAPIVHVVDPKLLMALDGVDFAEICIVSDITIDSEARRPEHAFRLPEVQGVAAVLARGPGRQMRAILALFRSRDRRPGLSRRDAARRAGAARKGRDMRRRRFERRFEAVRRISAR